LRQLSELDCEVNRIGKVLLILLNWIDAFGSELKERLTTAKLNDGSRAWQLRQFASTKDLISTRVKRRLAGKRHGGDFKWRA
jgi:hypothetical protein